MERGVDALVSFGSSEGWMELRNDDWLGRATRCSVNEPQMQVLDSISSTILLTRRSFFPFLECS
jgi:hypothetical protein